MPEARWRNRGSRGRAGARTAALLVLVACGVAPAPSSTPPAPAEPVARAEPVTPAPPPDPPARVRTGIDRVERDDGGVLAGLSVGLITNHTGRARDGRSSIDVLHRLPRVRLAALFGPEHGIRGTAQAGVRVEAGRDEATGLPVHSLYDSTRAPTAAEMDGLDALVFDMQDVGSRYYTYVWTMTLAMQAAAEHGVRFVVLDRPNPITGAVVQGNVLDPAFASFLGRYPVPMRHGLTAGEIATFVNGEYDVGARLDVVTMEGWRRPLWYDQTGLPWVAPSPNMPSLESALHYPGTCLFEQTSLSVGRGLPSAFQQIGAPWLEHEELARRLNARGLTGVRFEAMRFPAVRPETQSHLGEKVPGERRGVRFVVTDRDAYDPVRASVAALIEVRALHPEQLEYAANFDYIAGGSRLRQAVEGGATVDEIMAPWPEERAAFLRRVAPYLLYPGTE